MMVQLMGGPRWHNVLVTGVPSRHICMPVHYTCGCTGLDIYERSGDVGLFTTIGARPPARCQECLAKSAEKSAKRKSEYGKRYYRAHPEIWQKLQATNRAMREQRLSQERQRA